MNKLNNDLYYSNADSWNYSWDYMNRQVQAPEIQADHYKPRQKRYWNEDVEKTVIVLGFVALTLYVINYSYIGR